jgi:NAD(P)-dependent dehydrogenase (short-subunit alcohol dehydrogenase family)
MKGQVVFITGPARGIGAELARQLHRRGARVALAGLEPERDAAEPVQMLNDQAGSLRGRR